MVELEVRVGVREIFEAVQVVAEDVWLILQSLVLVVHLEAYLTWQMGLLMLGQAILQLILVMVSWL